MHFSGLVEFVYSDFTEWSIITTGIQTYEGEINIIPGELKDEPLSVHLESKDTVHFNNINNITYAEIVPTFETVLYVGNSVLNSTNSDVNFEVQFGTMELINNVSLYSLNLNNSILIGPGEIEQVHVKTTNVTIIPPLVPHDIKIDNLSINNLSLDHDVTIQLGVNTTKSSKLFIDNFVPTPFNVIINLNDFNELAPLGEDYLLIHNLDNFTDVNLVNSSSAIIFNDSSLFTDIQEFKVEFNDSWFTISHFSVFSASKTPSPSRTPPILMPSLQATQTATTSKQLASQTSPSTTPTPIPSTTITNTFTNSFTTSVTNTNEFSSSSTFTTSPTPTPIQTQIQTRTITRSTNPSDMIGVAPTASSLFSILPSESKPLQPTKISSHTPTKSRIFPSTSNRVNAIIPLRAPSGVDIIESAPNQDLMLSSDTSDVSSEIINLELADPNASLGGDVSICFKPFEPKKKLDSYCLGFLDESQRPPQWICEDKCLEVENDYLCGKTDHFTNFALLLDSTTGGNGNSDPCASTPINYLFTWLSLAFAALGILFVICAILAIELRFKFKEARRFMVLRRLRGYDSPEL